MADYVIIDESIKVVARASSEGSAVDELLGLAGLVWWVQKEPDGPFVLLTTALDGYTDKAPFISFANDEKTAIKAILQQVCDYDDFYEGYMIVPALDWQKYWDYRYSRTNDGGAFGFRKHCFGDVIPKRTKRRWSVYV